MHRIINLRKFRHSRESGNPGKNWIPGQAPNDKPAKIYVAMHKKANKIYYDPGKLVKTSLMTQEFRHWNQTPGIRLFEGTSRGSGCL
jgi:hypothetical protein